MLIFLYFKFDFAPGFGFQLILASHELRLEIDYLWNSFQSTIKNFFDIHFYGLSFDDSESW